MTSAVEASAAQAQQSAFSLSTPLLIGIVVVVIAVAAILISRKK